MMLVECLLYSVVLKFGNKTKKYERAKGRREGNVKGRGTMKGE